MNEFQFSGMVVFQNSWPQMKLRELKRIHCLGNKHKWYIFPEFCFSLLTLISGTGRSLQIEIDSQTRIYVHSTETESNFNVFIQCFIVTFRTFPAFTMALFVVIDGFHDMRRNELVLPFYFGHPFFRTISNR